jgi:predicted lactoylglutathione lyase
MHLVPFNPALKTSEIHNLFVLIPIWSIQVTLASYEYLLYSNNINYTMSHTLLFIHPMTIRLALLNQI